MSPVCEKSPFEYKLISLAVTLPVTETEPGIPELYVPKPKEPVTLIPSSVKSVLLDSHSPNSIYVLLALIVPALYANVVARSSPS